MPAFMLKKIVLGNFAKGPVDLKMADAIDFMVDRVRVLSKIEVADFLFVDASVDCLWPKALRNHFV